MADKRTSKRKRKRLKLRFGIDDYTYLAFTDEVSETGMFIRTPKVFAPGTMIKILLFIQDESEIHLEGRIMWAKRIPPQIIRSYKGGMGIRITAVLSGEAHYRSLTETINEQQ